MSVEMTDCSIRFGPLQRYAEDPAVTDIAVVCDGSVWVDRGSGMERVPEIPALREPSSLRQLAVHLCSQLGCRLDDAQPIADASSVTGVRIHAVLEPIVQRGAAISIRLPRQEASNLPSLAAQGMCPMRWVPMLGFLVEHKANMLITGATGSGKTTLMKALLMMCPMNERIVTVEEVRELGSLDHPDLVSLAVRQANVEGAGAIGLPDLVKATLRMRPDRIVVGECRGEEIVDMLRALNSGHKGGMTTLHANSLEHVPARLNSLGLLAGLDAEALAVLVEGAFDVVLHLVRDANGRHIREIGFLQGASSHGDSAGDVRDSRNVRGESRGGSHVGLHACLAGSWDGASHMTRGPCWDAFVERCQNLA